MKVALKMDPAIIKDKLNEMLSEFSEKPSQKRKKTKIITLKSHNKKIANDKQSQAVSAQMDNLRLHIKYLLFDLESTKRENNYFKKILGEQD